MFMNITIDNRKYLNLLLKDLEIEKGARSMMC